MNNPQSETRAIKKPVKTKSPLDLFFALSPQLCSIKGEDGYFKQLNQAWQTELGWTEQELRSQPSIEFVHPEDRESTFLATKLSFEQDLVTYQNRYRHKDGSYRWLSWQLSRYQDGDFYAIAQDITATKQQEKPQPDSLELGKLITTISTEFINLSGQEIDNGIRQALQFIGEEVGCDRSYVALFRENYSQVEIAYQWQTSTVEPLPEEWQQFPSERLPWCLAQLQSCEVIKVSHLGELPEEAINLKIAMQSLGSKSFIAVPIVEENSLLGCIGFAAFRQEKIWSEEVVRLLKIVGQIFTNALLRQQTELKRQDSERLFRAVFNQTFQFASILSTDGKIIEDNQTAIDFCQLKREEIVGRYFWQIPCWQISAETQQRLQEAIALAAAGETIRYEEDILSPAKTVVTIDFSLKPVTDETGKVVLLVAEGRDISFRKQSELSLEKRVHERTIELQQTNQELTRQIAQHQHTEEVLRNSEEQFRRVFDQAPIGMTLTGLDDRYIRVNRTFYEMLGYTESELMELTFREITHPEDLEKELPSLDEVRNGKIDSFSLEKRYLKKNQEILWANLTLMVLRNETGKALHDLAMVEDITQRKRADEKLRQSEARYRAIVEDQTELICRFKPDRTLTFVNDAYCRYFGKKQEQLLGDSFMPRVSPEDREVINQAINSLCQEQPIITYEHRVILSSGDIHWQQWTNRAMFNRQGNVIEYQAAGRDISKLKQAEANIIKALAKEKELSELRSGFVSLVSHEFRTPLTAILSSSELLERYSGKLSEEKKTNHFKRIQIAVARMTQLLDEVLTIGKAEAGKLECHPEEMNIVVFCQELVENMQVATGNRQKLNFTLQGESRLVKLDEKLLGHIITNLLSNAIKYSPQDGNVQFDLIFTVQSVIFSIQDQGIGIPKQEVKQLFESFRRASNVGNIQGTGLGLAIVKRCVDLHEGKIEIESEVGKGSTFRVTLPLLG
ncbi:MAG: PAS domain S-box protein [Coleofasciculaceae cyanobacterium]